MFSLLSPTSVILVTDSSVNICPLPNQQQFSISVKNFHLSAIVMNQIGCGVFINMDTSKTDVGQPKVVVHRSREYFYVI